MSAGIEADAGRTRRRGGAVDLSARWTIDLNDYPVDARWSHDGALVAVACAEGAVFILDGTTGEPRHQLRGHADGALRVAWSSPAGSTAPRSSGVLASAGQDGYARLWDPVSGLCLAELDAAGVDRSAPDHRQPPRRVVPWAEHVAWSPDGMRLATGAGREVRLWDATGRLVRRHPALASTVSALAWRSRPKDPDGPRLIAAGYGGGTLYAPERRTIDEQELAAGQMAAVDHRFDWRGSFLTVAWSPDGRVLAAGMQESAIHLWVAVAGKHLAFEDLEMSGYPTKVRELAWSADGKQLATGGAAEVTVWRFAGRGPAGTRPIQLRGHVLPVTDIAFYGSGSLLVSGGEDGQLLIWDLIRSTKKPLGGVLVPSAVSRVSWHPRERVALAAYASGRLAAWVAPR